MFPTLITACITPFSEGTQTLDESKFMRVLAHCTDTGSDGLLLFGTTGEGPTLSQDEKNQLWQWAQAFKTTRPVHLMAAISSNSTQEACLQAQALCESPNTPKPDSLLVVVPYYNKPTQAGMIAHFSAVARAANGVPIVIYNIPGRAGVRMEADTMAQLHAAFPTQIIGVKQSVSCLDAFSELKAALPHDAFHIWSGEDSLTLPMMALGGYGAISVSSHFLGERTREMITALQNGDLKKAQDLHQSMLPVFKGLFQVTNPILAKACMARMGLCQPELRLPMLYEPAVHGAMAEAILRHVPQTAARILAK
jgi:4-hydroxy-tetrahydrodipicolinate synthase